MKKMRAIFLCALAAVSLAMCSACGDGKAPVSTASGAQSTTTAGANTTSPKTASTAPADTTSSADTSAEPTNPPAALPVYDAHQDFNSSNAGPVWFYEVTNREGAWEKVTEYHEEWDGFLCIGAYGNAGVYGGASCAGLAPAFESTMGIAHDVCFKFVCPESGNITIPETLLEAKSDPSAKGAVVSILHNDQEIWSDTYDKSGADAAGKTVPEQKLSVKKGDVIRFKAHSLDTTAGNNGSFVWNIKVAYTTA